MPLLSLASPTHRTVRALTALAVTASGLSVVAFAPPTSAATVRVPTCVTAGTDLTCTVTFDYSGAEETYVVPDGVERVDLTAVGGAGGNFYGVPGGRPAVVTGSLDVTAGTTYHVAVAGNGGWGGGWNGGGNGTTNQYASQGGGGASDLRTVARTEPGSLESRVLVAGGGGGADIWSRGGNAGLNGESGSVNGGTAAGGGTQTQGGNGGNWFGSMYGGGGSMGQGGHGNTQTLSGGGGGGGLYGGGGGGYTGGGGGGSSLVPSGGAAAVSYDQGPHLRISRTLPIIAATGLTPSAATTAAGTSSATYSVSVTDGLDTGAAVPSSLVISPNGPGTGAVCTATTCSATRAGTYTVIGRYAGFTAHTTLTVNAAPATTLTVTPEDATATAGAPTAYTVTARDAYGNPIADDPGTTTVTAVPVGGGAAQSCSQGVCSPTTAGEYTVRANRLASGGAGPLTASTSLSVTPAQLATLTLSPDVSDSVAGLPVTYTAAGADAFGNSLGDQTAHSAVTIARSNGTGDTMACPGAVCTPTTSGTYRVSATQGDVVDSAALNVAAGSAALTLAPLGEVTYGDDVATSATLSGDATRPTPSGTVQFLLDGVEVGTPVPVPGDGQVTGPTLRGLTGGMHTFAARFAAEPEGSFEAATAQHAFVVAQAPTTTTVQVRPGSLTATVDGGSAGVPTGSVSFAVDGRQAGSAPLVEGVATLEPGTAGGADSVIAATYTGSRDFAASSGSTARHDPTISASLSSPAGEPRNGWYAGPVTVSFRCSDGSAPVRCPEAVTLDSEGAAQSVTRTVTADDGGVATVTAGPVNIDLTAPTARVGRVVAGATYNGKAPAARCVGADALSGVTSCRVRTSRLSYPGPVSSTVTVTDVAGNTTMETVTYSERDVWVSGTQLRDTAWDVPKGERARTHVMSLGRPRLTGGAATGRFHFAGRLLGRGHWRAALAVPEGTRPGTVLRIRISTGDGPRLLRLRVTR